jgi:hypothetical protein
MKKSKAGGARPGAGRPKGEPTEPMNLRVPKKYKKKLVKLVRDELERLKQK